MHKYTYAYALHTQFPHANKQLHTYTYHTAYPSQAGDINPGLWEAQQCTIRQHEAAAAAAATAAAAAAL